jgi:voltage-gated potassium channel
MPQPPRGRGGEVRRVHSVATGRDRAPRAVSAAVSRTPEATTPEARLRGAMALLAVGLAVSDAGDLSYADLKRSFRDALVRDPIDSLAVIVFGCSYLFYLAEQGENPRCVTFLDAVNFISTCLSVGYDDVFARTEAGKAIASFVMTFGPALAASALAPPAREVERDESLEVNRAILGKLDAILAALRKAP